MSKNLSCPDISGQIFNDKSDIKHDKTTKNDYKVQY